GGRARKRCRRDLSVVFGLDLWTARLAWRVALDYAPCRKQVTQVQKRRSPPIRSPRPPSIEPSPLSVPPPCGAAASMRLARRENGSDCSHTLPGPVSVARN